MTRNKPLYNREDARRMARTLIDTRAEQGESIPNISTRRMSKVPANVLSQYFARPSRFRAIQLDTVKNDCVVLRFRAGR